MTPKDLENFRENPVFFIEKVLGQKIWGKQKEIVESVFFNKRTMVASCHGSGKTNIVARIALAWLILKPYSVVITTAPTMRQVEAQLWKEIRNAYKNSLHYIDADLLPKSPKLYIDGDDWAMFGMTASDDSSFQGWHSSGGNLFILDEATGIQPIIWQAARGCLTSAGDHIIGIGNPTDSNSEFAKQFESERSNSISISAFDTPNVKAGFEVVKGLVSAGWVEDMQEDCGPSFESHPDYISRVLGRFPDKSDRSLIAGSWYDAAVERWIAIEKENGWNGIIDLGCDVAREGKDSIIFAEAHSMQGIKKLHKIQPQNTMQTARDIMSTAKDLNAKTIRIDADGLGAGIFDRAIEIAEERSFNIDDVISMRGGLSSDVLDRDGKQKYFNKRSEWFWMLRDMLDPSGENPIALPFDKKLRAQLTGIRWKTNPRGMLQIETKKEMLKRRMKSPDEADAVAYAMASPSSGPPKFDALANLLAMTR